MTLDPQVQSVLERMKQLGIPSLHMLSVEQARKVNLSSLAGPAEEVGKVENRLIPGPEGEIPIRIYTPRGEGPFSSLVYYHGGGWVVGNLESADVLCRQLANGAKCVVVSVDYRLAPENKFPSAVEDAFAAFKWVSENTTSISSKSSRIAVGGDSAGGTLAAVVSLMARDRGYQSPCFQMLFCPVTNHSFDTQSYIENADGYGLTAGTMMWFWSHYLKNDDDGKHAYASPLLVNDLTNLPLALVITAGYDPLRDEGEAYAERLKNAGVSVEAKRYDGMVHGFYLATGAYEQGRIAVAQAVNALKRAFQV